MNKQRRLPGDETIIRLEEVSDIQPQGQLFDAAGRHDAVATKVMKKEGARTFTRTLTKLSDEEFALVQKLAEKYAQRREMESS